MNSVISKEVTVLSLGEIRFKDAWEKQEKIFKQTIDTKIQNRRSENPKKTHNYLLTCSHPHVYTIGKSGDKENLLISRSEIEKRKLEYQVSIFKHLEFHIIILMDIYLSILVDS